MFTHLHVHSHYSLLDGLSKIDDLVSRAKELGMKSLALTDHGSMYGIIEFYEKAKKAGIRPILGCEIYLAPNSMRQKRGKIDAHPYHLVLLAKNEEGYRNLIKIVTSAHLEGYYYKPRVDFEFLKKHTAGLIALSACIQGEIARLVISRKITKAEARAKEHEEAFGKGNFYLEIQHHPNIENQNVANRGIIKIARKLGIPLVATCDSHYLLKSDAEIQDILLCIQTQTKVSDTNRLTMMGEDFSLKSPGEMVEAFKNTAEAISNTEKIAEMCNVEIELKKLKLPHFPVPKPHSADSYLKKLCYEGLAKKFGIKEQDNKITREQKNDKGVNAELLKRLEYELKVIEKTGFAPYLLIVQDYVNWAKNNKIVVGPGRGSAAGSLACYLLNITEVNPLKYDLLFERFLNPERISMPDIDLDFADTRRDEVIDYIRKKYGTDHVAQIVTFGKMAGRGAVRDVVRVLGYPYGFGDQISKMIPMQLNAEQACEKIPDLKSLYESNADAKKILDYAKRLEGVARHASMHACGVVMAPDDLNNFVPRQLAPQDENIIITQYEMHAIEDLGLLKMDLLGLKNLTIIQTAIKIIEKVHHKKIDIEKIPLDDKKTYELLQRANSTGIFQLESNGMKRYLKQLKPTEFENIIAMVALYRPGPMEWIPEYILRKHAKKVVSYIHPKLKNALEKTYGVPIYQEQVMQVAQDIAGFTLAEADVLRKAVGKKIKHLLLEQKRKFLQGAVANNISKTTAEEIFSFIEPFAGYGFNKSHATCYATIAYQTAYLKSTYPAEFMAALLTSDQEDLDRIAIEIEECRDMGLEVLPPDINESFNTFAVVKKGEKNVLRFALNGIKNLGNDIAKQIVEERKAKGKYKDFDDFIDRLASQKFNKKCLESLAKSGALDSLIERNQVLKNTEKILTFAKNTLKAKEGGQSSLFAKFTAVLSPKLRLEKSPAASEKDRLAWEKELLGLYISSHPLIEYREFLNARGTPCNKLHSTPGRKNFSVGGIINKIKKIITKNGEPMLFVDVEDLTGRTEVLVFPRMLKENTEIWQEGRIILISGRLSERDGEAKILCEKVEEISAESVKTWKNSADFLAYKMKKGNELKNYTPGVLQTEKIEITLPQGASKNLLYQFKEIFDINPGIYAIHLRIPDKNGNFKVVPTKARVGISGELLGKIEQLVGKERVKVCGV